MDLSQEEIEMVLEAGLEKVAYEEGLNDYAQSLEKVASVHGVDAVELHDFLEKAAADEEKQSKGQKIKQWIKNNPGKVGAGVGAVGLGLAANKGTKHLLKNPEEVKVARNTLKNMHPDLNSDELSTMTKEIVKKAPGLYGGLGAAAGAGAGALAGKGISKMKNKEKTAAAYGLDEDTFDALFNAGVEALSE